MHGLSAVCDNVCHSCDCRAQNVLILFESVTLCVGCLSDAYFAVKEAGYF